MPWRLLRAALAARSQTGVRVQSRLATAARRCRMLDLAPTAVADILGDRLPRRVSRGFRWIPLRPWRFQGRLRHRGRRTVGQPSGAVRLGRVHLGGTFEEIAATERRHPRGRMPDRPFVLVGQQYLADPGRSAGNINPIWAYAHVPHGYTGDATEAVIAPVRAVRTRLPRPYRRHGGTVDDRDVGVQPQLCGR